MKELWQRVRNRLRREWLVLKHDYKTAASACWFCGHYGAAVCSYVYPKRLCDACAKGYDRCVQRRAGLLWLRTEKHYSMAL
jgi:hypothetical protein